MYEGQRKLKTSHASCIAHRCSSYHLFGSSMDGERGAFGAKSMAKVAGEPGALMTGDIGAGVENRASLSREEEDERSSKPRGTKRGSLRMRDSSSGRCTGVKSREGCLAPAGVGRP